MPLKGSKLTRQVRGIVEFITIDETCVLLRWTHKKVLLALKAGTLVGKQVTIDGKTTWAIVHPGVEFVEYVTNPLDRCQHIPLLGTNEVAAILGYYPQSVRKLVARGDLKAIRGATKVGNPKRGGVAYNMLLFTPFAVREYLKKRQGLDPKKRQELVLEDVVKWFHETQTVRKLDSVELVEEEMRYTNNCSEPEKSKRVQKFVKMVDAVREFNKKRTPEPPASAPALTL